MAKAIDVEAIEVVENPVSQPRLEGTFPRSITELATHFIRGESWVKNAKNQLREIYWWMENKLFDETGSLTQLGFEKLEDLYGKTANTEIVEKRGRRQSERKKPEMSFEDYKLFIWTSNRKFPPGFASTLPDEGDTTPVNDPVNEEGVIEIEFEEFELNAYDPVAQIEENTELVVTTGNEVQQVNSQNFLSLLGQMEEVIAAKVEQTIVQGAVKGQNRGMTKVNEILSGNVPTDVAPVKTSRKKKTSGSTSA